MKQKILVTGANGQLGKALRQLASSVHHFDFIFLSKEEMPLHDFELVRKLLKINRPQYLINCAAYTAVDNAEHDKELAYLINGEAVGVLAASCKDHYCKFIHFSTDYVFDGTTTEPYTENAVTNPKSIYGASKLEGEGLAMQHNPDSIIIRTSWVYSEFGKNFVKTIQRLLKEKKEINVVNDQFGSPTYAADLAQATLAIITSSQLAIAEWSPGIYNYSNEGIISWYDFAVAIKEAIGSHCIIHPITTAQYPTLASRPAYSALDNTKIQQVYGIQLKKWRESLQECLSKLR